MCGIAGFIDFKGRFGMEELKSCNDIIENRGPDDSGYDLQYAGSARIGLAHRRLSIMDPSPAGHQPMKFEHLTIVFNGEIYNFQEIKKELTGSGYGFHTGTDTEMILKAFDKWGMDCVRKFRGMFAFAIWNNRDNQLILCRDRMGVKPLYFHWHNDLFLFASELKSFYSFSHFNRAIDQKALSLYLQYGYIPAPYSIFQNTYKLEPGKFLTVNLSGDIKKHTFYDLEKEYLSAQSLRRELEKLPEEEVMDELERRLIESFTLRMVADVPVGMFLSGGIDSSILAAILQKSRSSPIKTFTIGYREKKYNEAPHAAAVAKYLRTDHTELICTSKEAFDIIPQLPHLFDEPFGDSSAVPTYLVSKLAREQVTVSLSADGADEQFFGYDRYIKFLGRQKGFWKLPGKKILGIPLYLFNPDWVNETGWRLFGRPLLSHDLSEKYLKLRQNLLTTDSIERYNLQITQFTPRELQSSGLDKQINALYHLSEESRQLPPEDQVMLFDMKTYLTDDILTKVDRATMGVSLEGREPFLDQQILEFTSALPFHYKYRDGTTKYLLKKLLYKYVPEEMVNRPKMGFGMPVQQWFRNELKGMYMDYLSEKRLKEAGIFNEKHVGRLLKEFLDTGKVPENKIWFLFIFELWREKWL